VVALTLYLFTYLLAFLFNLLVLTKVSKRESRLGLLAVTQLPKAKSPSKIAGRAGRQTASPSSIFISLICCNLNSYYLAPSKPSSPSKNSGRESRISLRESRKISIKAASQTDMLAELEKEEELLKLEKERERLLSSLKKDDPTNTNTSHTNASHTNASHVATSPRKKLPQIPSLKLTNSNDPPNVKDTSTSSESESISSTSSLLSDSDSTTTSTTEEDENTSTESKVLSTEPSVPRSRDQVYSVVIITFKLKVKYEHVLRNYKQRFSAQVLFENATSKKKYFALNGPASFLIEPAPEATIASLYDNILFVGTQIGMNLFFIHYVDLLSVLFECIHLFC
jgi:hypothetical protein